MGRPRKDSPIADAKQRLIDSFWLLLETHRLHEITVGMIAAEAQCNRGTFYYHYSDLDELITRATELEFLASNGMLSKLFGTMSGRENHPALTEAGECSPQIKRIALLVEQGGFDLAFTSAKNFVLRLWVGIVCPDTKELTPAARLVIEYAVCGLFGIFVSCMQCESCHQDTSSNEAVERFALENSRFLLGQICLAQGTSPEEALLRLQMADDIISTIQKDSAVAKKG